MHNPLVKLQDHGFSWALASYYPMQYPIGIKESKISNSKENYYGCQGRHMHMIKMILRWIGQQGRSHAILALNSDHFLVQTFNELLLDSPRIAHRLDMIIKHHKAYMQSYMKQTIKLNRTVHQTKETASKKVLKMFYTLLRIHRHEKHSNRSYNEKVMN